MHTSPAHRLGIAVEDRSRGVAGTDWIQLTASPRAVRRISSPTLIDAQRRASATPDDVFVDVEVLVADTTSRAYDRYRAARPGWQPGARVPSLVHPGTIDTVAGLLADIAVAGVADGVTLTSPEASLGRLIDLVYVDLAERLRARGVAVALQPRPDIGSLDTRSA